MTRALLLTAAGAALLAATPACAKPLQKVPVALDPAKAYILIEYRLLKNPYAGFPGSRKTMPLSAGLTFARYDPTLGDVRGLGKAAGNPVPAKQEVAEGFRNKPLVKGDQSRLFLLEVEPDLWVVQAFANTSFSLGSYAFRLEPGTITDLGVVEAENDYGEGQRPPKAGDIFKMALAGPFAKGPDMAPMRVSFHPRGASDLSVPTGIAHDRVKPVEFTSGARFGNYMGGLVNRIEGVNARLRSGAGAAAEAPAQAPASPPASQPQP